MVNAPEFAFSGYASWPLRSKYGTLIPRFDWTFKDQVFLSPENDPRIGQAPLWLFNFRLGYRTPDSKFEISGWVRNLTNEAYALEVINLARLRYSVVYAIGDPRTYGITVGARF
jgi:iron complex outermembrane receptor protein